ncbi:hypothetical protein FIBSPDRAFT_946403 [Athelia psychrophila]|uniref:Mini-chromosome maintenance complex-binding protein n=1 Tax=Athelia psychrophila TaxID=1759441 RepID=A0A166SVB6_9AGAM|nr:hypothetical protein FIBSPDRAFT_946403 [Fibularhizoctonia sp. CBS 109695]
MVSSNIVDTMNDPTRAINDLYDPSKDIQTFPSSVAAHFAKIFESPKAFTEIPVLDVRHPPESHPPRALVRFRAMIQDTSPSPEMYLSKLTGDKCGGWGITEANPNVESPDYEYADLEECTVLWAVTVPGENDWLLGLTDKPTAEPHIPSQPHKYPFPGVPHIGVQVKIYDNSTPDSLKATDISTFVGILTLEPLHSELDRDAPLEVPTLHVLYSKPHSTDDHLPALSPADDAPHETIHGELISWIADEALAGDRDAAEWVILTAVGRVQSRNPPILPPSLTLARFPSPEASEAVATLSHVLGLLLPISTTVPLSLPLLNTSSFTPESKDEDLHSGYLQLPAGCVVLVTESGVAEGKVVEKGIVNIKALQDVMKSQSLPYMFPFSSFSFPTDLDFIILAEGRKSAFFQTDITVFLQPDATRKNSDLYKPPGSIALPPPEKLAQFRQLILAAKTGTVQVAEAASGQIQDDFVKDRQKDSKVTAEDLILKMTIARLLALLLHRPEVTVEIWERAKALDRRRVERHI